MNILRSLIGRGAVCPNTAPPTGHDRGVAAGPSGRLISKERTIIVDHEWVQDVRDEAIANHIFQRVSGKKIRFTNVDFRYCTFDSCYLRLCTFDSCDFTGCRFVGTNFHGSTFSGCNFEYAVFERTLIDSDVLDSSSPARENLRLAFARTLRTNYQALGDSDAVNKAILVELNATRVHLSKAWRSSQPYYREKYRGLERVFAFLRWTKFVAGDALWGNGERAGRLVRTSIGLVILITLADTLLARNPALVADWWLAFTDALQVLLGTKQPNYPGLILALIALTRYVLVGLFVSILVRRLARR
jgi:hypothetical protein